MQLPREFPGTQQTFREKHQSNFNPESFGEPRMCCVIEIEAKIQDSP